jgi:hypothetical protein
MKQLYNYIITKIAFYLYAGKDNKKLTAESFAKAIKFCEKHQK